MYDINGDGYVTRTELNLIINSMYELRELFDDPRVRQQAVNEKVDAFFKVNEIYAVKYKMILQSNALTLHIKM